MIEKFPFVDYVVNDSLDLNDTSYHIKDISVYGKPIEDKLTNQNAYVFYTITDGETIEHVSKKFYNSNVYVYHIMMMNNIIDPVYGWVMSVESLLKYTLCKYDLDKAYLSYAEGSNEYTEHLQKIIHSPHHWVKNVMYMGKYIEVDSQYPDAMPISNIMYETELNEKKRTIKLIRPNFIHMYNKDISSKFL